MYPRTHALTNPDKVAARLVETGEQLSYAELEERSTRLAHLLREAGLRRGDVVALLSNNDLRCFEVYWAAMRSGLYITAVNHHLAADEVAYIVNDSGQGAGGVGGQGRTGCRHRGADPGRRAPAGLRRRGGRAR
jgi:fatty-acyl-CoA synthase